MEAFEPPKYVASLIAAINDGAKSAQLGALAFSAIGLFLLATTFSATDEDLLLNQALTISQLGATAVPVVFAFGLAPAVFVAVHFYTLIRYDMLAGNIRQLVGDLQAMVPIESDRNRCRQLLANVEFISIFGMPKGSRASSWTFDWTVRALLAVFPVFVLLIVQLQSLRLQSEWVTWMHHACIFLDLVLLVWFFGRLHGDENRCKSTRQLLALSWVPLVILAADLMWLEVRGSPFDRWWPWYQPVDQLLCTPGAWGCRFLTVTHRIIVSKVWDATTFVALRGGADLDQRHLASFEGASQRDRELAFSDLGYSELFAVDLSWADLYRAQLGSSNLTGADLSNAYLISAYMTYADLRNASLFGADLSGADLSHAILRGANLTHARLPHADLSEVDLTGANLRDVYMPGAVLIDANLSQTRFSDGADLPHVILGGANLTSIEMKTVNLDSAQLDGANLNGAILREVNLRRANLDGASLTKVDLTYVDLGSANLRNVSLSGATLKDVKLDAVHGLEQSQLAQACGKNVLLPPGLTLQACQPMR